VLILTFTGMAKASGRGNPPPLTKSQIRGEKRQS